MSGPDRIPNYAAFWPFYLSQHSKRATRAWHIAGTAVSTMLLAGAVLALDGKLVLAAIVAGYGPAWISHALVERNRPATFRHPLWSLMSDFRMAGTWLAGSLDKELQKAGIGPPLS